MWTTRASVVSHCMCCRQVAAYMLVAVGCIRLRWQVFILSRDPWKMTAFYSGWRFHNLLHPTSIYYHMKIWIMIPSRLMLTLGFGSVEKCQAVRQWFFQELTWQGSGFPALRRNEIEFVKALCRAVSMTVSYRTWVKAEGVKLKYGRHGYNPHVKVVHDSWASKPQQQRHHQWWFHPNTGLRIMAQLA